MIGGLVALVAVGLLAIAAIRSPDSTGTTSPGANTQSGKSMEQLLGSIDGEAAQLYKPPLDSLSRKCREPRDAIGDMSAAGKQAVKQRGGGNVTTLEYLWQMDKAIPAGQTNQSCADTAAAIAQLMIAR